MKLIGLITFLMFSLDDDGDNAGDTPIPEKTGCNLQNEKLY